MTFHFGKTTFPGCLRFYRGTISAKGYKDSRIFFEHPITWWLGFSWAGKCFVGFIRTDTTRDVRE